MISRSTKPMPRTRSTNGRNVGETVFESAARVAEVVLEGEVLGVVAGSWRSSRPAAATVPVRPSTATISPVCTRRVTPATPTTVGMPSSRPMMAVCERTLPFSLTKPGRGDHQEHPAGIGGGGHQDLAVDASHRPTAR